MEIFVKILWWVDFLVFDGVVLCLKSKYMNGYDNEMLFRIIVVKIFRNFSSFIK